MTALFRLFFEYFKIGLFAVGGGNATIPFLYELAEKTGWFSAVDITNMIAISEATPGPFGVNMASYVGYTVNGVLGCLAATLGFVAPSVIIIIIVWIFLKRFRDNRIVNNAFNGLRPASLALISCAFLQIVRVVLLKTELFSETGRLSDLFNLPMIIMAAVIFVLMRKIKLHPLVFVAASAAVGIILRLG